LPLIMDNKDFTSVGIQDPLQIHLNPRETGTKDCRAESVAGEQTRTISSVRKPKTPTLRYRPCGWLAWLVL